MLAGRIRCKLRMCQATIQKKEETSARVGVKRHVRQKLTASWLGNLRRVNELFAPDGSNFSRTYTYHLHSRLKETSYNILSALHGPEVQDAEQMIILDQLEISREYERT